MICKMRKNSTHILYRMFHSINAALNNLSGNVWIGRYFKYHGIAKPTKTNCGQNMDRKAHAGSKNYNIWAPSFWQL